MAKKEKITTNEDSETRNISFKKGIYLPMSVTLDAMLQLVANTYS